MHRAYWLRKEDDNTTTTTTTTSSSSKNNNKKEKSKHKVKTNRDKGNTLIYILCDILPPCHFRSYGRCPMWIPAESTWRAFQWEAICIIPLIFMSFSGGEYFWDKQGRTCRNYFTNPTGGLYGWFKGACGEQEKVLSCQCVANIGIDSQFIVSVLAKQWPWEEWWCCLILQIFMINAA